MRGADKYAAAAGWDHSNLNSAQTKMILLSLGVPKEVVENSIKEAKKKGHAEFRLTEFIPTKAEKIAEFRPKAAELVKAAASVKRNLFKEASFIDNAQTVDALLSLNFVTPDNITKFVGKIPHFKATISHLASSLIASRLGMKEIPEEASAVAMERLIEVVNGLEKLRASQEVAPK